MSQIVDYAGPYLEMLSIFLRLLERVIDDSSWAAEADLQDVVLVGVRHTKGAAVDLSLTGGGQLKGISAAGTGTKKEPKYVALQVVIDKMNDLFGAESFTESQVREFVQGLVQQLLVYPGLVNQTQVNSKKQFLESPLPKRSGLFRSRFTETAEEISSSAFAGFRFPREVITVAVR